MNDHLRPSFQPENFRGNDCSPMRDAACQAYAPENQSVFKIDIRSTKGTESLPGLQIVFEQDSSSSRGNSGHDRVGDSRYHSDDSRRDFSPSDRNSQFSHNPWHHGHERHSHHRMNDSSSSNSSADQRFLGNDRSYDNGQSSRFDRLSGSDNNFVSTDSPPWEAQNGFGTGSRFGGRDGSRYSSPLELLNQLADYFRQNELSNSLDSRGFSSSGNGAGSSFRLVDTSFKAPSQLPSPEGILDAIPTPPGLPKPGDLLSSLPTPPGLPKPGDLLSSLPTPPGLPKPGDLLSALPTPPGLPSPGDLLSSLPTPPGLPNPGDILSSLPTPPGLPSPKNIFDKLPNPFKLFG
ncbi:MAG: hypothetical protein WCT03_06185 [Candidatus Obscuribacterales bacterium]